MRTRNKILAVVTLSLVLVGCKFGNKTKTTLTGYDTISGLYSSLPQTISFRVQIGAGAERTKNGLVSEMPDFLKKVMNNPTMLYFDDPVGGIGSLRAREDTSTGIPTYIQDKAGTFGASSSAGLELSGCRLYQTKVNSGTFTQLATTTTISGAEVRGTITVDFALEYTLTGDDIDCDPMRARFKTCYIDDVNCSSDASSIFYRPFVQETFDPYVNSGLMTPAEIGSFRTLGYSASYR